MKCIECRRSVLDLDADHLDKWKAFFCCGEHFEIYNSRFKSGRFLRSMMFHFNCVLKEIKNCP